MTAPIVKSAVICGICHSPADRYDYGFQCQANSNHLGDLIVGIFSDLTPPTNKALDVAPILLELDQIQEAQLKADILDYYASQNAGRFSSLNAQKHRDKSARRQERSIELRKQLQEASCDYRPLQFKQVLFLTPFYTEKDLARYGNPKQRYRIEPGIPNASFSKLDLTPGCRHEIQAATLLEGSEKAKAEHLEKCLTR